ncbi:MAG: ilvB, partial [Caulobacteraceae bacterium]|nr:ilvB [Caulobacteraceae bacterium]
VRPAASPEQIEAILDLLAEAERPAIIAGAGSVLSPCAKDLGDLATLTGTPVVTNSKGHGVLAPDHPAYGGPAGVLAMAALAGAAPDLVLLLGARMGMFTGGRGGSVIPAGAKVVQIDIDGGEIGRLRGVDISVVADASAAVAGLLSAAKGRSWPDRAGWLATLKRQDDLRRAAFRDAPAQTRPGYLHPSHAVAAVFDALSPETLVVSDGGEAGAWVAQHARPSGPGSFMTCGYLGCLGVGPGFAIGAARAQPGRPIVCFTGDGGAGFNIQEFDTMVRHRLPILTVILNNACWGMSQNGQDLVFGRNRRAAVALAETHYEAVAAGFGAHGERVDRFEDIGAAVRRAQASGLPACLNLITDPEVVHPVTVAMVGDVSGQDSIPIPYYENIPLRPAWAAA